MGRSILQGTAVFGICLIAGLLYMGWDSFKYDAPKNRLALLHSDGTPISR